jgi:hypothetical protein
MMMMIPSSTLALRHVIKPYFAYTANPSTCTLRGERDVPLERSTSETLSGPCSLGLEGDELQGAFIQYKKQSR